MKSPAILILTASIGVAGLAHAKSDQTVSDAFIAEQRANLAENTAGQGFGPQSPRDIDAIAGNNPIVFSDAPAYTQMNLCNIHFHKYAEHKGGQFTQYAGNGDGHGFGTGFKYSGTLSKSEKKPVKSELCPSKHGSLNAGDTIEVHYVHSTAPVKPGKSLGSCLAADININPQLRVETQVFVLVNDPKALDFGELTQTGEKNGYQQALAIPSNTGTPIQYSGSTTGPGYNETASPIQVTWSVRPQVAKVNAASVGEWCKGNLFEEDHAHGVRNLVINPDLLSPIQ
jgi:hypothetical protein